MQELLSPRCSGVNILGILNLSRDVIALQAFGEESGIEHLSDCFHRLWHLLDIILKNDPEVMLDPERRYVHTGPYIATHKYDRYTTAPLLDCCSSGHQDPCDMLHAICDVAS